MNGNAGGLDGLVGAVAQRLLVCRFAATEPYLCCRSRRVFEGRKTEGLVRAVAERLALAAAADAPPVGLAGLDIDGIGRLLRRDWFCHVGLPSPSPLVYCPAGSLAE